MSRLRGPVLAAVLLFCAASARADTRAALVIGNSAYDAVGALPNPQRDAALVADTLKGEGFAVTLVQNASRAALLQALNRFNDQADAADWALVYYAGHGIEVGGTNYLLPTDARLKVDRDAQDEAVPLTRVLDTVANARKLRVVILDACRNNPFAASMRRSVATRAVDRGLARVEPQAGILVVYAAKEGEVAEDGRDAHSPFTTALVSRLKQPGLEVSRLFNVVTADVLDATGRRQRPFVYGSNPSRDDFYFTPPAPTSAAASPADPDAQQAAYAAAVQAGTADAFTSFISRYPTGPLATIAKLELAKLQGPAQTSARPPASPAPATVQPATTPANTGATGTRASSSSWFTALFAGGGSKPSAPMSSTDQVAAVPPNPALKLAEPALAPDQQMLVDACDRSAASLHDQDRQPNSVDVLIRGRDAGMVDASAAIPNCRSAVQAAPHDRRSVVNLGRALQAGKMYGEAKAMYEQAAAGGNVDAMRNLGDLYAAGLGVEWDYAAARSWYEKAATIGDAWSMLQLGDLYHNGLGGQGNPTAASSWYERSAATGNALAMLRLGDLYSGGSVFGYAEQTAARSWYEKAAAAGNAKAMSRLGDFYRFGLGVVEDHAEARSWFEKAVAAGDEEASTQLAYMTEADSAKAGHASGPGPTKAPAKRKKGSSR